MRNVTYPPVTPLDDTYACQVTFSSEEVQAMTFTSNSDSFLLCILTSIRSQSPRIAKSVHLPHPNVREKRKRSKPRLMVAGISARLGMSRGPELSETGCFRVCLPPYATAATLDYERVVRHKGSSSIPFLLGRRKR